MASGAKSKRNAKSKKTSSKPTGNTAAGKPSQSSANALENDTALARLHARFPQLLPQSSLLNKTARSTLTPERPPSRSQDTKSREKKKKQPDVSLSRKTPPQPSFNHRFNKSNTTLNSNPQNPQIDTGRSKQVALDRLRAQFPSLVSRSVTYKDFAHVVPEASPPPPKTSASKPKRHSKMLSKTERLPRSPSVSPNHFTSASTSRRNAIGGHKDMLDAHSNFDRFSYLYNKQNSRGSPNGEPISKSQKQHPRSPANDFALERVAAQYERHLKSIGSPYHTTSRSKLIPPPLGKRLQKSRHTTISPVRFDPFWERLQINYRFAVDRFARFGSAAAIDHDDSAPFLPGQIVWIQGSLLASYYDYMSGLGLALLPEEAATRRRIRLIIDRDILGRYALITERLDNGYRVCFLATHGGVIEGSKINNTVFRFFSVALGEMVEGVRQQREEWPVGTPNLAVKSGWSASFVVAMPFYTAEVDKFRTQDEFGESHLAFGELDRLIGISGTITQV